MNIPKQVQTYHLAPTISDNDCQRCRTHKNPDNESDTQLASVLLRKFCLRYHLAITNFASVTWTLNSQSLPFRLIKCPTPVVQKQHFEVVFVPPARCTTKVQDIKTHRMRLIEKGFFSRCTQQYIREKTFD